MQLSFLSHRDGQNRERERERASPKRRWKPGTKLYNIGKLCGNQEPNMAVYMVYKYCVLYKNRFSLVREWKILPNIGLLGSSQVANLAFTHIFTSTKKTLKICTGIRYILYLYHTIPMIQSNMVRWKIHHTYKSCSYQNLHVQRIYTPWLIARG